MKDLRLTLLTAAAAAILATPLLAQPPGGGRGGMMQMGRGMGIAQLISNAGVQDELKFSDELKAKVREFAQKQREAMQGLQDLSPEERREKMQEIMAANTKAAEAFVKEHLSADQAKRLRQIMIQNSGLGAFAMEDVVKALKLTDEQREKLRGLGEDMRNDMRELFTGGGGGDPQESANKMRALGKEYFEKAKGLLTDEQKKAWEDLVGKPFEVKMEMRRRDR
jgi:Spy/CpxP family protein refolding chaperone